MSEPTFSVLLETTTVIIGTRRMDWLYRPRRGYRYCRYPDLARLDSLNAIDSLDIFCGILWKKSSKDWRASAAKQQSSAGPTPRQNWPCIECRTYSTEWRQIIDADHRHELPLGTFNIIRSFTTKHSSRLWHPHITLLPILWNAIHTSMNCCTLYFAGLGWDQRDRSTGRYFPGCCRQPQRYLHINMSAVAALWSWLDLHGGVGDEGVTNSIGFGDSSTVSEDESRLRMEWWWAHLSILRSRSKHTLMLINPG